MTVSVKQGYSEGGGSSGWLQGCETKDTAYLNKIEGAILHINCVMCGIYL